MPEWSRLRRLACQCALLLACLLSGVVTVWSFDTDIVLSERMLAGAERKYGVEARQRLLAWRQLIGSARGRGEADKLRLVNDFFNTIPFVSDIDHWQREDYWATPAEMLASNGGDCEDFSIAKYFSLVALGVSVDKLRITYVKARDVNPVSQAHMVLTYYTTPGAEPLVLDNLIPEIKPASQRPDLTPVYSFNGDGLWLAKARGDGKAVKGGSGNISLWRDLVARIGKEFD
ncbi:transglutaminase-like cysteine peptidase [Actimicrobium antarcticum]|uniref:transglutaminase-like cysteine peptidase n=1 Tax=Actimicrobium antarcticum TaxID=1051899 RepID=UPI0031DD4F12